MTMPWDVVKVLFPTAEEFGAWLAEQGAAQTADADSFMRGGHNITVQRGPGGRFGRGSRLGDTMHAIAEVDDDDEADMIEFDDGEKRFDWGTRLEDGAYQFDFEDNTEREPDPDADPDDEEEEDDYRGFARLRMSPADMKRFAGGLGASLLIYQMTHGSPLPEDPNRALIASLLASTPLKLTFDNEWSDQRVDWGTLNSDGSVRLLAVDDDGDEASIRLTLPQLRRLHAQLVRQNMEEDDNPYTRRTQTAAAEIIERDGHLIEVNRGAKGRFSKMSAVAKALEEAGNAADSLAAFDRPALMREAKRRNLDVPRGASVDQVRQLVLDSTRTPDAPAATSADVQRAALRKLNVPALKMRAAADGHSFGSKVKKDELVDMIMSGPRNPDTPPRVIADRGNGQKSRISAAELPAANAEIDAMVADPQTGARERMNNILGRMTVAQLQDVATRHGAQLDTTVSTKAMKASRLTERLIGRRLDADAIERALTRSNAEDRARNRQAAIDVASSKAAFLADLEEALGNDTDIEALRRMTSQSLRRNRLSGDPRSEALTSLIASTFDPAEIRRAVKDATAAQGLRRIDAGEPVFDPKQHVAVGKLTPGEPIELVRPGYATEIFTGEQITLSKPTVASAPMERVPDRDRSVRRRAAARQSGADSPMRALSGSALTQALENVTADDEAAVRAGLEGRDLAELVQIARDVPTVSLPPRQNRTALVESIVRGTVGFRANARAMRDRDADPFAPGSGSAGATDGGSGPTSRINLLTGEGIQEWIDETRAFVEANKPKPITDAQGRTWEHWKDNLFIDGQGRAWTREQIEARRPLDIEAARKELAELKEVRANVPRGTKDEAAIKRAQHANARIPFLEGDIALYEQMQSAGATDVGPTADDFSRAVGQGLTGLMGQAAAQQQIETALARYKEAGDVNAAARAQRLLDQQKKGMFSPEDVEMHLADLEASRTSSLDPVPDRLPRPLTSPMNAHSLKRGDSFIGGNGDTLTVVGHRQTRTPEGVPVQVLEVRAPDGTISTLEMGLNQPVDRIVGGGGGGGGGGTFALEAPLEETLHLDQMSVVRDDAPAPMAGADLAEFAMPEQLAEYWVHGEGAAKVRWGTRGAFRRARRLLRQAGVPEHQLDGAVANLYRRATGKNPGRHRRGDRALALGGGAQVAGAAAMECAKEIPFTMDVSPHVGWRGPLAPIDIATGDKRRFAPGALTSRRLPLPFAWQKHRSKGHDGAVTVGALTSYDLAPDGSIIKAAGYFLDPARIPEVVEAMHLVEHGVVGPSVDLGPGMKVAFQSASTGAQFNPNACSLDGSCPDDGEAVITQGEIVGATLVPIAAFAEARAPALFTRTTADDAAVMAALSGQQTAAVATHWDHVAIAPIDTPWPGDAAARQALLAWSAAEPLPVGEAETDFNLFRLGFLHVAGDRHDEEEAYRLPIAAVIDGELQIVPQAVFAAAMRLDTLPITSTEKAALRTQIDDLYDQMAEVLGDDELRPPWQFAADDCGCAEKWAKAAQTADAGQFGVFGDMAPYDHNLFSAKFDGPTAMTVTEDGRVFGHAFLWSTCNRGHRGMCLRAPRSSSGYKEFHLGAVRTDKGLLPVGKIVMGEGHADIEHGTRITRAFYDATSKTVALGRITEDQWGGAFAGVLAPGVTPQEATMLLASPPSGDWRGRELIAVLAVNVPGHVVARAEVTAGEPVNMVAAGRWDDHAADEEAIDEVAALFAGEAFAAIDAARLRDASEQLWQSQAATIAAVFTEGVR